MTGFIVAALIVFVAIAFRLAVKLGEKNSDYEHMKRMREYAQEEAKDWADMPHTDDDFTRRLQERIKRKSEAKNKR
jgi:hypothetical protein